MTASEGSADISMTRCLFPDIDNMWPYEQLSLNIVGLLDRNDGLPIEVRCGEVR